MAGVQAGSAGRLSIEIVAEIARLQQDLDKAKRAVNAASSDIARSARAANDNLAAVGKGAGGGVQRFSRDIANLKAQLDPAWAAQQRFNEAQRLGLDALKAGAITREQFIAHMRQISAARKEADPAARAAAAAAQAEAQAQREASAAAAQAERQAQQYIASLEREAAAIGRTSAELKQMEVDARAAAAAQAGYDNLARQIRETGAALQQAQANAATAAAEKERLAAEATRAAAAEQRYAASLSALKATIDPVTTAQARVNAELDLAVVAFQRGDLSAEQYEQALDVLGARLNMLAGDRLPQLNNGSRLATHHLTNLGFQVQDLGIQFAMAAQSSSPLRMAMMALMQQGSQIAGIMGQAEIGVKGLAAELGGMVTRFAAAHPYLVAFTVIAGVAASAMKLFAVQLNAEHRADLEAYANSLGLTKEEMEKLGPITVGVGDVLSGLGRTFQQEFGLDIPGILEELKRRFLSAFDTALGIARRVTSGIYAAFVGTFNGVKTIWAALPAVIGEVVVGAANLVVKALNSLLDMGARNINAWVSAINAVTSRIPGMQGFQIGAVTAPKIPEIRNQYAGAARAAAGAFLDGYAKAFSEAESYQKRIGQSLVANTLQAAKDRFRDEAAAKGFLDPEDAKKAGGRAGKAAGEGLLEDFLKSADTLNATLAGSLAIYYDSVAESLEGLVAAQDAEWQRFGQTVSDAVNAGLEALNDFADAMTQLDLASADFDLGQVFGRGGDALAGMAVAMDRLAESTAAYAAAKEAASRIKDAQQRETALAQASAKHTDARVRGTVALLGATKNLFAEQSAGYKAVEAAEKAAAAVAVVRTAIHVAQGASKIFAALGPFGFPVVAAMLAVMAGLGFRGGGGASVSAPTSAEDLQAAAGAGSVLGDPTGQSESIAKALEIVAGNSNKDLEYANQMLRALRSIDSNIGALAGNIAQQISVSGSMFDTSGARLGSSGSGGFLGIGASSTTRTLYDLGLSLNSATVADIIANNINGQTYQIVQQVKKKSGFLGIGGGTKTTYETSYGAIDESIRSSIAEVVTSLRNGLVEASRVIGLQGAEAMLDGFRVELGKISFAGMTGQEIEDQLNAIFSKVGDDMAGRVLPALAEMQQIGEGLFETFVRVAREYQVVDMALGAIGMSFGLVGVSSLKARDELVQLFGTLDDFASATEFFGDRFLSEAERIAPIAASVRDELTRLGLSGISTRDQFKNAVLGLDLTTSSGRELYAALMAVAPAFDKVAKYAEDAADTMTEEFGKAVSKFRAYADSLGKYRDTLRTGDLSQANAYRAAQVRFITTSALAAAGDAQGLADLQKVSSAFLDASKAQASTAEQYQRDYAAVLRAVDSGITAADDQVDIAEAQLKVAQGAVEQLMDLNATSADAKEILAAMTAAINDLRKMTKDAQDADRSQRVTIVKDETA